MRKIFIVVAPVGHYDLTEVKNPKTPEEVAQDVVACAKAGASMVHLHVRDAEGHLTRDPSEFFRTVEMIRNETDIIIQGSSGGVPKGGVGELSREERCSALSHPKVEVGSLNMGSVNFGRDPFINSGDDIRYWAAQMKQRNVVPELEIFEGGMLRAVGDLIEEGYLRPPYFCAFCPGYSLPANAFSLFFLQNMLPRQAIWGVNHQNMSDFSLIATALGMGACYIRVGFEDGIYYAPGKLALTNSTLVTRASALIKDLGFEVATPKEARNILGITKLQV